MENRANVWLLGGGTFGRRAASGFAGGRKKSCELAEGGLFSSPLFSRAETRGNDKRAQCTGRRCQSLVSIERIYRGQAQPWLTG